MNLRDIVVYCDTDLRIRKGCKKQDDVGANLIAAMHKSPWMLFFSLTILIIAFFRRLLIIVIAALSIPVELEKSGSSKSDHHLKLVGCLISTWAWFRC
jgi:hypothetical protein